MNTDFERFWVIPSVFICAHLWFHIFGNSAKTGLHPTHNADLRWLLSSGQVRRREGDLERHAAATGDALQSCKKPLRDFIMFVQLKKDYFGQKAGCRIDVDEPVARTLFDEGVADTLAADPLTPLLTRSLDGLMARLGD